MKKIYFLMGMVFLVANAGWGQQIIGSFPTIDGGFEGQTSIATQSSIATGVQVSGWTIQNTTTASATLNTTGGRSGPKYVTLSNGATASRFQSPTVNTSGAIVNATAYTVQFYYKTSGSTAVTNFQRNISPDGTGSPGTYNTITMGGTSGTWTLVQVSQTSGSSAASPKYGIGILRLNGASAVSLDIDDYVIYAGTADNTAPNSPGSVTISNPTTSSLDVSWVDASGGVDGGGYVVVRYSTNPLATDDPNQNGIYSIGNSVSGSVTGTVAYIGTGTSFTDNGLSANTSYYYKVYTVDKAFNYSAESTGNGTTNSSSTPIINVSASSLTSFGPVVAGSNSAERTYTVDGANLVGNLNVTAPAGVEVSLTSGSYTGTTGNTIPIAPSSGTVSSTNIYARFSPVTATGFLNANITNSSSGATTKNVNVQGFAIVDEPTSQASISVSGSTTNSIDLSLSGGNGSGRIVVARANNPVNADPADGPAYLDGGGVFTAGTDLGGGNYVVYIGTASGTTVTNLSSGTTYHFAVYAYSDNGGSPGTANYLAPGAVANATTLNPVAGLQISAANTAYTIDFDNTVAGVNVGQFNAQANFAVSSPATGQLNSNAWAYSSSSVSAASTFGGTVAGGNGVSTGGTSSTGVYAATISAGNNALAIQPASSTWTSGGNYTLRIQNQTGGTITSLIVSCKEYVYNDQGRSTTIGISTSPDNATYAAVTGYNMNTPVAADGTPAWKTYIRQALVTGLSISTGSYYYIRFTGIDNGGSGSRDEIAFDDVTVVADPTSFMPSYSGSLADMILGSDAQLAGNTIVETDVTLNNADLLLGNNNLTVGNTVIGGSAAGYIKTNGTGLLTMNNITAAARTFPIGNATYNPLTIANGSGHNWSANVEDAVNNVQPPFNTDKAVLRTWNITPSVNPPAAGADLTFQYNDGDLSQIGPSFNTAEDMQLWHYTVAWVASGGAITPGGSPGGVRTVTKTGQSSFSPFALANISGGLPVTYLTFSGYKDGSRNQLKWTTATEINNRGFEVLRSSDGVQFSSIGFVNSLALGGNSNVKINYTFTDNAPTSDKLYYRLRQEDLDGQQKLSNIVFIRGGKPTGLLIDAICPNPAKNSVNVIIATDKKQTVTLFVTDMAGRNMIQRIVNVETGSNTVPLDITGLNSGIYLVRMICGDGCDAGMVKLIKE